MNIEKMREEFEAWFISVNYPNMVRDRVINQHLSVEPCGGYTYRDPQVAWKIWQASRAAIEVELPSEDNTRCHTVAEEAKQEAYNQGLGECRYAIESLGLKVKS